ncbi:MAG: M56 family metallopeptidase [Bacteroidales bacterium]|nr:M56 family metallopeptidase [Bacteroidales bacterium]
MIHWMLFSTLAAGLLYGLYCLTLRRDRWLQLNLWYLLVAIGFSMVFPFIKLPDGLGQASQSVASVEEFLVTMNEVEISAITAPRTLGVMVDLYLVGVALCAVYLLFQLAAQVVIVIRLRRRHKVYRASDGFDIPRGAALVLLDDDTAPYSFFNHIVVGTRGLNDDEVRCILAHESLHVRQGHTVDLLFARLLCCLMWFNPFAWLIMREIRAVHEFLADAASIGACGREGYLHLLYRQATGTGYGHITNNFKSINLKKRIVMMNKSKTRFGAWKVLAALPVVALLTMVGCKPATEKAVDQEEIPFEYSGEDKSAPMDADTDQVFQVVEVDPEFPGGIEALIKYLSENIKYPEQAKKDKIQGKVYISFVVEKDGSVADAKVLRGIGGGCDEEALRVVNAMPKWTPGKQRNTPVRVQFNLPVVFKLQ